MDRKHKVSISPCGLCTEPVVRGTTRLLETDLELSRSVFQDADDRQCVSAGVVSLCDPCVAWVDGGGPMPARLRQNLEMAVLVQRLHPQTARQLHAELVGWAEQLRDALRVKEAA